MTAFFCMANRVWLNQLALQLCTSSKEDSEIQFDWHEAKAAKITALSVKDRSTVGGITPAVLSVLDDGNGVRGGVTQHRTRFSAQTIG